MAAGVPLVSHRNVVYYLRDKDSVLVEAWTKAFQGYSNSIQVSKGDIAVGGAPYVDAVVSPSNSFGFMAGGIDETCLRHFGQQIQNKVHDVIRNEYDGELLVGQAAVIPTSGQNGRQGNVGHGIKFLISAPTMRVSADVSETPNAYLCFRAVLLAVDRHNLMKGGNEQIRKVLVPGLGTGYGRMPKARCAAQMLQAYETIVMELHPRRLRPQSLLDSSLDHQNMCKHGEGQPGCTVQ